MAPPRSVRTFRGMIRVRLYMYDGHGLPYIQEMNLPEWAADDPELVEPFINAARPGVVRLPLADDSVFPVWTEDVSGVKAWRVSGESIEEDEPPWGWDVGS